MKKNANNQKNTQWYSLSEENIFKKLNSSIQGLNENEAQERLKVHGKNSLPVKKALSPFKIILNQISNPLIYVLIAACTVSIFIGDIKDAVFIFLVIIINSAIGSYQEWKAEKSSEALRNLLKICVQVKRDRVKKIINSNLLVPGDIVYLE